MNRAIRLFLARPASRLALPIALVAVVMLAVSCTEDLPTGPTTFASATMSITSLPDTLVIEDSYIAAARVTDAAGHFIQGLSFNWTAADTSIAKLGTADTSSGRNRTILPRRGGVTRATVSITDPRFVIADVFKQFTVVGAGVRILSSKDTTITAINDTAVTVGMGLVRVGGAVLPRASQGVKWVHKGVATTGTGVGDTLRFVARANGVDTLIVSSDFCLSTAKCADTTFIRVAQSLKLTLSLHGFTAWSFNDTVGPSITLADKRGNGGIGSSIRFVPVAAADSAIVSVTALVGTTNPVTGSMAVPRLVTTGNGTARVRVLGLNASGTTADIDSVTTAVRQVARRIGALPLRSEITEVDSIPFKAAALDARGSTIADATVTTTASQVTYASGRVIGVALGGPYTGTIFSALTAGSVADPTLYPAAPQIVPSVDTAQVSVVVADTAVAGAARSYTPVLLSSGGAAAVGVWVRGTAPGTVTPDSALTDGTGRVTLGWTPPGAVARYTFTARTAGTPLAGTLADSAGRVLLRRSLFVKLGSPSAAFSTASIDATNTAFSSSSTTVSVTVRDGGGNLLAAITPATSTITFTVTPSGVTAGTLGGASCTAGVCSFTYTAPATATTDTITVLINGAALGSTLSITVP